VTRFWRVAGVASMVITIGVLGILAAGPATAMTTSTEAAPCLPIVGCDPAGRLAGDAAQIAAQGMLDASARWIADGATTLLSRVTDIITRTTSVDLESPHGAANWFGKQYAWMRTLAAFVILPMLLVAAISAVVHQDPSRLIRAVAVHLPLAVIGTAVGIELTNRALQLTDLLSNQVSASLGSNVQQSLDAVVRAMDALAGTGPAAGGFVLMIGTLLVAFGALLVWIELLVRASAIYVAVLFLPLVLSGLLWPATARWARRMIELLVALILSKFVIVAVISLAGGALSGGGGLDAVLAGAALMLMAAFAPFVLLRLVPIAEAGVIGHLEGLERRPVAAAGSVATRAAGAVASGGGFTATQAGFVTDSQLSPALGAVLPDPSAPSFGQSFGAPEGGQERKGSAGLIDGRQAEPQGETGDDWAAFSAGRTRPQQSRGDDWAGDDPFDTGGD
jgi:hypothetical protein